MLVVLVLVLLALMLRVGVRVAVVAVAAGPRWAGEVPARIVERLERFGARLGGGRLLWYGVVWCGGDCFRCVGLVVSMACPRIVGGRVCNATTIHHTTHLGQCIGPSRRHTQVSIDQSCPFMAIPQKPCFSPRTVMGWSWSPS
jgi:hypothetical protein